MDRDEPIVSGSFCFITEEVNGRADSGDYFSLHCACKIYIHPRFIGYATGCANEDRCAKFRDLFGALVFGS